MSTVSPLFRNTLFVVGLVMLAMGIGNTIVAHFKVQEYQSALAHTPPAVGAEQTFGKSTRLHHFSSEAWSRRALDQAKLDFYHVLHRLGWLMLCIGVLCTIIAVRRHRDVRPGWIPPETSQVEPSLPDRASTER